MIRSVVEALAGRRAERRSARKLAEARAATLRRVREVEAEVAARAPPPEGPPVLLFNASSHVRHIGPDALAALVTTWAIRLQGRPVVQYACRSGLSQCVLGATREGPLAEPPCAGCQALRGSLYPESMTVPFTTAPAELQRRRSELSSLPWGDLMRYSRDGLALGEIVLPSVRWVERRYRLVESPRTRALVESFLASAGALADDFHRVLATTRPEVVLLFNGSHYPEATARAVAHRAGVRVVTFESGFRGPSMFFSHGVATSYEIDIPESFQMGEKEDADLDRLLAERFSGRFAVQGRPIWDRMTEPSARLAERMDNARHAVVIFGNTAWDTSQTTANTVFPDMFAWIAATLDEARSHPETLFVVRAHPDEARAGKEARENVEEFLANEGYLSLPNVVLVGPRDRTSSYDLLARADVVLAYNSTVALEAAIAGRYVLLGGHAKYSGHGVAHEVPDRASYLAELRRALRAPERVVPTPGAREAARRWYYWAFFRTYLAIGRWTEPVATPEFTLRSFPISDLTPEQSPEIRILLDGILKGGPFHVA